MLSLLPLLTLALQGAGCDAGPLRSEDPYFTALLNGAEWSAEPIALINRAGGLAVVGDTGARERPCPPVAPCESLSLVADVPFGGPGAYALHGVAGRTAFRYMDGDAVLAEYDAVGSSPGFTVTAYDNETGWVEGTFDLTFALETSLFPPGTFTPPDTVRVSGGRFRAVAGRR